ncbi:LacI family DNA-binding transcriptional regulator [Micromonospora sp. NPDC050200]|uniref:LacI family DNA-binding transcriptional regulator n=1 Tax=Micromonospora sp. NPDC050200 TaxID=3155664 RepID=UPI0033F780E0
MADVAARAGVSTATVSRVLSGSRPVAEDLRRLVLGAARDLGYKVNLVGRALRKGRTSTLGLLVPDLDNPFFSSLAQHLSRTFDGSGIDVLVFSADDDLRIERRGIESFLGRQVDTLVIIPCHESESSVSVALAAESTLTIQLDRRVSDVDVHFVGCDNHEGMRLVEGHVSACVDQKRQPVVYVGASTESSSGHERLEGFRSHFGEHPTYLGTFDFGWGQDAAQRLLADGFRSATVVTAADIIGLGLLGRLQSLGHRVPEDFRVIGFDGIGVARLAHPTLTTVRQPVEEIGRTILNLINTATSADRHTLVRIAPELVIGESSPA